MPRPKKSAEAKVAVAPATPIAAVPTPMIPLSLPTAVVPPNQPGVPHRVVDNDSFLRVRDSVSL